MASLGDIKNNYEKLKQELKLVRYANVSGFERSLDGSEDQSVKQMIMSGAPFAFLPLIHHCLLVYSSQVADFITNNGFDLYSKNDMRFMESSFKMLVLHFNYKPALSIKQFFENGYAEHKIILIKDVC